MKTIGIDIGTTNTKVVLYDAETVGVVGMRTAPTPTVTGNWGTVRDPDQIVSLIVSLIKGIGTDHELLDVAAISVSCVGEEIVLLGEGNRSLCPIIPWFDSRSWIEHEMFLDKHGSALFRGASPGPWYSLFKLLWIQRNHQQVIGETKLFTDIGSFVLGYLCGKYTMDWSHASRTGAFDLTSKEWNLDVIRVSGLSPDIFPELVPSGSNIARIDPSLAGEVGLPNTVVICSGGHDHFCAAYGGGVRDAGDVLVSAGTSEACFVLLEKPIPNLVSKFPAEQGCFVDGELYYVMISIPSGHQFQQWKSLLYGDCDDEAIIKEMEARGDPTDVQFAMANDLETWSLNGSSRFFSRAVVMRAIQEGLAEQSRQVVEELFSLPHRRGRLFITGKPVFQPFWRNLRLRTYQQDLYLMREVESAALGAAIMASHACGAKAQVAGMVECLPIRTGGIQNDAIS